MTIVCCGIKVKIRVIEQRYIDPIIRLYFNLKPIKYSDVTCCKKCGKELYRTEEKTIFI